MILLLSGYKRSGKDTVANRIMATYNNFEHLKFADGIIDIASQLYNIYDENWWQIDKDIPCPELNGLTKRDVLKTLGQNIRDNLNYPTVWVNWLINNEISICKYKNIVISDLRMPQEEYHYFKKVIYPIEVYCWYIEKPDVEKNDTHVTESHYDEIKGFADEVIFNDRDINSLNKVVDARIKKYL